MKKSVFCPGSLLSRAFRCFFRLGCALSLPDKKTVSHALSSLSVPFVENKGQIDESVAFYAKTLGSTLFITRDGEMVYGFSGFTLVERIAGLTSVPKGLTPSPTKVSSFIGNDPSAWQRSLSTYTMISLGEITPGINITLNAYGGKVEKIITVSPHTSPSITLTMDGASSIDLAPEGELIVHTDKGNLPSQNPSLTRRSTVKESLCRLPIY